MKNIITLWISILSIIILIFFNALARQSTEISHLVKVIDRLEQKLDSNQTSFKELHEDIDDMKVAMSEMAQFQAIEPGEYRLTLEADRYWVTIRRSNGDILKQVKLSPTCALNKLFEKDND